MKTLDALRSEHAAIRRMVDRLEAEIDGVVERGAVDGEALDRLLAFFEGQVDGHHQEKEERVFFPRLLSRADGEDVVLLRSLLDDHASERKLLALMRCEVEGAAFGEPNSIAILAREARRYIQHQRQHSRWEEAVVFPLAERVLSQVDDRAIWNGFNRLDDLWGRPVAKVARSLAQWLDQRRELVPA